MSSEAKRDCNQYPICLMDVDWRPSHCKDCNQYRKKETTKSEQIKRIIAEARKSLDEDLKEFGIVGNGFWETVEEKILKVVDEER